MASLLPLDLLRDAIASGRGQGVRVAIIDSGVDWSHPRLAGATVADDVAIVRREMSLEVEPGGVDLFGHGTAIAGTIHALAPLAELGSFRVLGEQLTSRSELIAEGVRTALDRGYHVLNCSFGCGSNGQILQYKQWIDEAYLAGVHIVAACNNVDARRVEWPGFFPSVVTVDMDRTDDPWSLRHRPGSLVELLAQGVDVNVAWLSRETKVVSGSSYAAPRVAAMIARLLSVLGPQNPLLIKAAMVALASENSDARVSLAPPEQG